MSWWCNLGNGDMGTNRRNSAHLLHSKLKEKYSNEWINVEKSRMSHECLHMPTTVVSRKKPPPPPPFCNLSLSTKRRVGLYAGCDYFSRDYAPPSGTLWPHCRWGGEDQALGIAQREAERCSWRYRYRLTSFNVEGRGSRALPRSSWRVHRWCGRFAFAVDTLTVDSRVATS